MKTTNRQVIREAPWGMLVWQLDTGEFLADEDNNFMHVFCTDQNPVQFEAAKKALTDAARSYGFPDGKPVFWAGKRPIDDAELAYQEERARQGLVPDPLDIGAIKDEMRGLKNGYGR